MMRLCPSEDEKPILDPAEEEAIDRAADELLDRYREAFVELAK